VSKPLECPRFGCSCPAVFAKWLEKDNSYRLLICLACGLQMKLCLSCDRGNIYCSLELLGEAKTRVRCTSEEKISAKFCRGSQACKEPDGLFCARKAENDGSALELSICLSISENCHCRIFEFFARQRVALSLSLAQALRWCCRIDLRRPAYTRSRSQGSCKPRPRLHNLELLRFPADIQLARRLYCEAFVKGRRNISES
jgi:hypothetical protein